MKPGTTTRGNFNSERDILGWDKKCASNSAVLGSWWIRWGSSMSWRFGVHRVLVVGGASPVVRSAPVHARRMSVRVGICWVVVVGLLGSVLAGAPSPEASASAYATYRDVVVADDPVSYWRLDDADCGQAVCTLKDEMGNHDGQTSPTGATFGAEDAEGWWTGVGGTGVSIESIANGPITVDAPANSELFSQSMTVEAWVDTSGWTKSGGMHFVLVESQETGDDPAFSIRVGSGDSFGYLIVDSDLGTIHHHNDTQFNSGHVVVSFDASDYTTRIYVDGDLIVKQSLGEGTLGFDSPSGLTIGE
ncbi:MAG: LamG domain-containing protein [bacterium]|nr:LamG domain-containing protein [bacterium]